MPISKRVQDQIVSFNLKLTPEQRRDLESLSDIDQAFKLMEYLPKEMADKLRERSKKDVSTTIDDLKKQYKDVATAVESSIDGITSVIQKRIEVFNESKKDLNDKLSGLLKGSEEQIIYNSQRIAASLKEGNFQDILNVIDDMDKQVEDKTKSIIDRASAIDSRLDVLRNKVISSRGLSENQKKEKQELEKEREDIQKKLESDENKLNAAEKERLKTLREEVELRRKESEELKQQADVLIDITERQKTLRDFAGQTTEHFRGMMAALSPGSSGYSGTIFSSLASQMVLVNQGVDGFGNKLKSLSGFLANSLTKGLLDARFAISGFFDYLYNQSIGKAFELSKMFAESNKQTGGFGNISQNVVMGGSVGGMGNLATKSGLSGYGIGLQELNKSVAELQTNFKNFNNLSLATQQALTVTSAKMENLGVATSQSAKLIETFSSAFGKTAEGASKMMEGMARDAIALGINVNKYFQEFESVMNKISGFATSADQIFKKLSAISQATKLSTDEIAGMSEKFKTIEGASEAVAGLNAALGGTSLRATELIQLDPAEAFLRIKEELDASGKKFEDLNIGFKRYLANAAGFNDVNAAAKGFSSTLSEIRSKMDRAKASQEDLEKAQKRSAAFQEQYKKLLENVTVLVTPIIQALTTVVGWITKLNDATGGWILPLVVKFAIFSFAIRRIGTGILFLGSTIATTARGAAASLTSTAVATTEVGANTTATGNIVTRAWGSATSAVNRYIASVREASAATKTVGSPGTGGIPGGIPNGGKTFMGMGGMGWGMLISMGLMAAASATTPDAPSDNSPVISAARGVKNTQDAKDTFIGSGVGKSSSKIIIAGESALKLGDNDEVAASPNLSETFNSESSVKNSKENNYNNFSRIMDVKVASAIAGNVKGMEIKTVDAVTKSQLITQNMQQNIDKKYEIEQSRHRELIEKLESKSLQNMNLNAKLHIDGKEVVTTLGPHTVEYLDNHTEHTRKTINKVANALGTSAAV